MAKINKRTRPAQGTAQKVGSGFSLKHWPTLLVSLVVLVGIVIASKQYFVNTSEAAINRMTTVALQTTSRNDTVQRTADEQKWIEEAVHLFHDEYNACFRMANGPEKCNCMENVIKKFEELRARILADGKNHDQFIAFWIDYYIKLIRETMTALDCSSVASSAVPVTMPARSMFSKWLKSF